MVCFLHMQKPKRDEPLNRIGRAMETAGRRHRPPEKANPKTSGEDQNGDRAGVLPETEKQDRVERPAGCCGLKAEKTGCRQPETASFLFRQTFPEDVCTGYEQSDAPSEKNRSCSRPSGHGCPSLQRLRRCAEGTVSGPAIPVRKNRRRSTPGPSEGELSDRCRKPCRRNRQGCFRRRLRRMAGGDEGARPVRRRSDFGCGRRPRFAARRCHRRRCRRHRRRYRGDPGPSAAKIRRQVYDKGGLPEPVHRIEYPLKAHTRYF